MPYVLKKSNGVTLATIDDGSINIDTDLTFVGKNYAGYGEILNQNLVKLLENFSNATRPGKPLAGQLWYDSSTKKLKVFDGVDFKSLAKIEYGNITPSRPSEGDLWWNTSNKELKLFNGLGFVTITTQGTTVIDEEDRVQGIVFAQATSNLGVTYNVLKYVLNDQTIAVSSLDNFTLDVEDPLYGNFLTIKKGLTISGANSFGSSNSAGTYFWGTAGDSLRLNNLPASDYALKSELPTTPTALTLTVLTATTNIFASSITSIGTGVFNGTWNLASGATLQSTYADIAERYHADSAYDEGTVLVIGGKNEVTASKSRAETNIAGVVSKKYSMLLNNSVSDDNTHPAIALKGRIPCRVKGPINKGDLLVTSDILGYAESFKEGDSPNAVIGRSLESFSYGTGVIEIKV
jgi:hypothetical protein